MKIAIYSPYLDSAGGGEKYMLTIGEVLSAKNEVDILLDVHLFSIGVDELKSRISKLHNLDLLKLNFIKAPIGIGSSFLQRYSFLKKYDWFFANTDGSIPYASAKNNVLHFQVPFVNTDAVGLWGKIRQSTFKMAICNSNFTKSIIQKTWKIPCEVVYPPVDLGNFKALKKKKQILNVGRFRQEKKQKVLIEAFKKIVDQKKIKGWSLHLAGGVFVGDELLIEELKKLSKGYDIFFHENISLANLSKLYGYSSIYWHATGYLEDDPKVFEHFGISTVEAMASSVVPVVIKKGGQIEIVEENVSGLFWENIEELIKATDFLIKNPEKMAEFASKAKKRSEKFSKNEFRSKIEKIVYGS